MELSKTSIKKKGNYKMPRDSGKVAMTTIQVLSLSEFPNKREKLNSKTKIHGQHLQQIKMKKYPYEPQNISK